MSILCPVHEKPMDHTKTRYGSRWDCPEEGCTVMLWGGDTSTPADQETRDARKRAHRAFAHARRLLGMTKGGTYKWLAGFLDVPPKDAHIGMLDKDACDRITFAIEQMMENAR